MLRERKSGRAWLGLPWLGSACLARLGGARPTWLLGSARLQSMELMKAQLSPARLASPQLGLGWPRLGSAGLGLGSAHPAQLAEAWVGVGWAGGNHKTGNHNKYRRAAREVSSN